MTQPEEKFRLLLGMKNGRQLATYKLGDVSASYDYDENGIRTSKTVNGITTTFQLDGSKIVSENRNGTVQSYFYDENGSVLGIVYGGENYYFRKNFRGDVLAILTASGEVVVEYSYDPWGNLLAVTGTLASTLGADNPFRYRGYYYDAESCFYYLNSRYYDAKVCRFVNADDASNLGVEDEEVLSFNLFAYCMNNPINRIDADGDWSLPNWAKVVIGAVATVAAVAVTVATGGAAAPVLVGVAASTLSGAAIGYATGGKQGMIDGAADGFMWGGIGALASSAVSAVKAVKAAKQGVTIGERMNRVTAASKVADTGTYKAMKGYNAIKKISPKLADKLSYAHNKAFITRMTKLGAPIYDAGPVGLNISSKYYAMERSITAGYWNYVKMW